MSLVLKTEEKVGISKTLLPEVRNQVWFINNEGWFLNNAVQHNALMSYHTALHVSIRINLHQAFGFTTA
jgi:hypothetical protein